MIENDHNFVFFVLKVSIQQHCESLWVVLVSDENFCFDRSLKKSCAWDNYSDFTHSERMKYRILKCTYILLRNALLLVVVNFNLDFWRYISHGHLSRDRGQKNWITAAYRLGDCMVDSVSVDRSKKTWRRFFFCTRLVWKSYLFTFKIKSRYYVRFEKPNLRKNGPRRY